MTAILALVLLVGCGVAEPPADELYAACQDVVREEMSSGPTVEFSDELGSVDSRGDLRAGVITDTLNPSARHVFATFSADHQGTAVYHDMFCYLTIADGAAVVDSLTAYRQHTALLEDPVAVKYRSD